MKRLFIAAVLLAAFGLAFPYLPTSSEEPWVRSEFAIPAKARTVEFDGTPSSPFKRTSMEINAVFQFSPSDYLEFLNQAMISGEWLETPISDEWFETLSGEATDDQIASFKASLAPIPADALVQWRTDGVDIVQNSSKALMTPPPQRPRDFAMAVLDHQKFQLHVCVRTYY